MKHKTKYAKSLIVYYIEKQSAQKTMKEFSIMLLIVCITSEDKKVVVKKAFAF